MLCSIELFSRFFFFHHRPFATLQKPILDLRGVSQNNYFDSLHRKGEKVQPTEDKYKTKTHCSYGEKADLADLGTQL